jgi:hypothetical protein
METNSKTIADPYKKTCKYEVCRKTYMAKRTNQDYCCPDHRIKANNALARISRIETKATDLQAKKNRKILELYFVKGQTEVSTRELEFNGFNFEITTRANTVLNNQAIYYYYEYNLRKIANCLTSNQSEPV